MYDRVQQFACSAQLQISLGIKRKNRSLICRTQLPFHLISPCEYCLNLRRTAKQCGIDLTDTQGKLCWLTVMRSHVYSTPTFWKCVERDSICSCFYSRPTTFYLVSNVFIRGNIIHDRHNRWIQLLKRWRVFKFQSSWQERLQLCLLCLHPSAEGLQLKVIDRIIQLPAQ